MATRLRDPMNGLPSGFHYLVPETGVEIKAGSYSALYSRVQNHLVANNISFTDTEARIQEFLCSKNDSSYCYNDEHPLPPFSVQVVSLLHAGGSILSGMLRGHELREDEPTAKARMAICEQCEFYRKSDNKCAKCSCRLAAKTALRAMSCPVGKW